MSATADSLWTADSNVTVDAVTQIEPTFSADQYGQAARALLPPGRAWNREDGSNQALFCDAVGQIYAGQDRDSLQMLADFFPQTATQGIDEWNSTVGIPDACSGMPATSAENQQQIVAKLTATGGQSIGYYQDLAAVLGFEISVSEFSATIQGNDAPAGLITKAQDWAYTWRVNVISGPADTTPLSCLLTRYKPAHTQFYIVTGAAPLPSYRLLNAGDNVAEALLIQQ